MAVVVLRPTPSPEETEARRLRRRDRWKARRARGDAKKKLNARLNEMWMAPGQRRLLEQARGPLASIAPRVVVPDSVSQPTTARDGDVLYRGAGPYFHHTEARSSDIVVTGRLDHNTGIVYWPERPMTVDRVVWVYPPS